MDDVEKAITYFCSLHKDQFYKDGSAYWPHLLRVLYISKKIQFDMKHEDKALPIAALGHDSIEDTKITLQTIQQDWGEQVASYIHALTNHGNVETYVSVIKKSALSIRIIKIADLIDNYRSVTYSAHLVPKVWFVEHVFPVMDPMTDALIHTSFDAYWLRVLKDARALAQRVVAHVGR